MLAGVLLPLCLAPVQAVAEVPTLAAAGVLVLGGVLRFARPWAVPAALVAAVASGSCSTGPALGGADLAPGLVWTAPRFDPATLVGVGLPLFLVTMASQNVPGMAVLAATATGRRWPRSLRRRGWPALGAAPFGGHAVNLAAITAALAAGPDAHPDPGRRWIASVTAGVGLALSGSARRGDRAGAALAAGAHRGGRRAGAARRVGVRAAGRRWPNRRAGGGGGRRSW